MKSILLGSLIAFSSMAFATEYNPEGFHKKFKLVRDEQGKLIEIRSKVIETKFSIKPYLIQLKEDLIALRDYINTNKAEVVDAELDEMIDDLYGNEAKSMENEGEYIKDSIKVVGRLDVEGLMAAIQSKDVLTQYENKLTQEMAGLSLNTIANVNDSKYFYKRAVTYRAVQWALDYAKKQFSNVPLLNTATYVIVKIEKMIRERRNFHQNLLLHYFENVKESDLGLTKEEMDLVLSSIYESRIAWNNMMESRNAAATWSTYGANLFYSSVRAANTRVRNMRDMGTEFQDRLNFGFIESSEKGEKVILNLFNNRHMVSFKPAIAFNYAKPEKVLRTRQFLGLGQIGLSFIPVSDGIKGLVNDFIDSTYEQQRQTEGALLGYFESTGQVEFAKIIKKQYHNPYDLH
jgi:hypothetical protein